MNAYKVKMLKTIKGVQDGEYYPKTFLKDEIYSIRESLYNSFMGLGVIELCEEESPVEEVSAKEESPVEEENKMNNPVYETSKKKDKKKDKKKGVKQ
jgi:hypothetical protein